MMIPDVRPWSRRTTLKLAAGALCMPVVPMLTALGVRAADPVPLTTYTDQDKRISFHFPGDWKTETDPANLGADTIVKMQGMGIAVYLATYAPTTSLDGNIQYYRDNETDADRYARVHEDPASGQIGGEPARVLRYHYTDQTDPTNIGVVSIWFVDHAGTRFRFIFDDDYDRHTTDIAALLSSVTFPPVATITFTDPTGLFSLQIPQYWTAARDTTGPTGESNVLKLTANDLTIYGDIFDRTLSLDDDIAYYRAHYPLDPNKNTLTFDLPRTLLVNGKPARSIAVTSSEKAHPEYSPYIRSTWFVDYAGKRLRFETGDFGAHGNEILAMMQSVQLLPQPYDVYTSPDRSIALQYPRGWMVSKSPLVTDLPINLVLDAPFTHIFLYAIPGPSDTVEDTVQFFSDDVKKNATVTEELRADDHVGGIPARTLTYRYHNNGDPEGVTGVKRVYVMDHNGTRYVFQCTNLDLSAAEIADVMASVSFAPGQ